MAIISMSILYYIYTKLYIYYILILTKYFKTKLSSFAVGSIKSALNKKTTNLFTQFNYFIQ